jgi:predicted O-linked N-acetylglucosamine transferase (SPINDLY family)
MADLIAQTTEEYVGKAVALATDLQRLGSLREGLRQQLQSSPILDAQKFTRSLEAAFRSMWGSRAEE